MLDATVKRVGGPRCWLVRESTANKKLAEENAKAVQGLNPKINVWNTGNSTSDPMNPILNIVQSMAPMLDGLEGKIDLSKLSTDKKDE